MKPPTPFIRQIGKSGPGRTALPHHPDLSGRFPRLRFAASLAMSCFVIWQLSGCASYSTRDAGQLLPGAMPYTQTNASLSLGADPYVQPGRQEQVFGADLLSVAIIPIQVTVVNVGDTPLRIDPEHFKLYFSTDRMTTHRPGHEVAKIFTPTEGVADYATSGVGMLGGLAGPIGSMAGRAVALLSAGALGSSRTDAIQAREADYIRKELKPTLLAKQQLVRGFLFFVLPRETPAFKDPILVLTVVREAQEIAKIQMELKGVAYPGKTPAPENGDKPDKE